jgi:hypothetical protein
MDKCAKNEYCVANGTTRKACSPGTEFSAGRETCRCADGSRELLFSRNDPTDVLCLTISNLTLLVLPLILFFGATLLLLVFRRWSARCRCTAPDIHDAYWDKVSAGKVFSLAVSAASFVAAVVGTTALDGKLFALGILQIVVVIVGNGFVAHRIVERERAAGRFDDNTVQTFSRDFALLKILSWTNLDVLELYPWREPVERYLGLPSVDVLKSTLASVAFRDVPHLALQAANAALIEHDAWRTSVIKLSICFSSLSLLVGVTRKLLIVSSERYRHAEDALATGGELAGVRALFNLARPFGSRADAVPQREVARVLDQLGFGVGEIAGLYTVDDGDGENTGLGVSGPLLDKASDEHGIVTWQHFLVMYQTLKDRTVAADAAAAKAQARAELEQQFAAKVARIEAEMALFRDRCTSNAGEPVAVDVGGDGRQHGEQWRRAEIRQIQQEHAAGQADLQQRLARQKEEQHAKLEQRLATRRTSTLQRKTSTVGRVAGALRHAVSSVATGLGLGGVTRFKFDARAEAEYDAYTMQHSGRRLGGGAAEGGIARAWSFGTPTLRRASGVVSRGLAKLDLFSTAPSMHRRVSAGASVAPETAVGQAQGGPQVVPRRRMSARGMLTLGKGLFASLRRKASAVPGVPSIEEGAVAETETREPEAASRSLPGSRPVGIARAMGLPGAVPPRPAGPAPAQAATPRAKPAAVLPAGEDGGEEGTARERREANMHLTSAHTSK